MCKKTTFQVTNGSLKVKYYVAFQCFSQKYMKRLLIPPVTAAKMKKKKKKKLGTNRKKPQVRKVTIPLNEII